MINNAKAPALCLCVGVHICLYVCVCMSNGVSHPSVFLPNLTMKDYSCIHKSRGYTHTDIHRVSEWQCVSVGEREDKVRDNNCTVPRS